MPMNETTGAGSIDGEKGRARPLRPNFLFILTDDQGPWATSRNWPELITPALDEIATTATVFDNYYCASPVCSPARASLLTGYMPSAHGVHDWLVGGRHPDDSEETFLDGISTLPEVLHDAGYMTAMSGKWHVGSSKRPAPGFDLWYAHRYGGGPYYDAPIWGDDGEEVGEPRYFTDAVAEEAVAMIDAIAASGTGEEARPFYLQVNFTAPHSPWVNNHPQELLDLYADTDFPSVPRETPHPWTKTYDDFADAFADPVPSLRGYAASLTGVDRAVRSLVDALDAHGMRENTVIIYMADNGFSCGHHGLWGKGNGTYPLNFWENSVRVPCMISVPGQRVARTVERAVSACSFFETVCDLAGVAVDEDPLRDGASVSGLLMGDQDDAGEESVVVFDEYGGGRMIRRDDYKFIDRFNGPRELYDLSVDPDERENLVDLPSKASLAQELADELYEWFRDHETDTNRAYHRDVRGRGQVHPPRDGYADARTYVLGEKSMDGVENMVG